LGATFPGKNRHYVVFIKSNYVEMQIISKSILLICFILFSAINSLQAQSIEGDSKLKKTTYSGFIHTSKTLEDDGGSRSSSKIGFGLDIDKRINSNVSLLIRSVWRPWNYDPESIIHICFAPKYSFHLSDKITLSPFLGIGPSLIMGNDYALIAASSMGGLMLNYQVSQKNSIILGGSINQAMSFHSGHFEFMDVFLGISF
jgi:hypothetical protein